MKTSISKEKFVCPRCLRSQWLRGHAIFELYNQISSRKLKVRKTVFIWGPGQIFYAKKWSKVSWQYPYKKPFYRFLYEITKCSKFNDLFVQVLKSFCFFTFRRYSYFNLAQKKQQIFVFRFILTLFIWNKKMLYLVLG